MSPSSKGLEEIRLNDGSITIMKYEDFNNNIRDTFCVEYLKVCYNFKESITHLDILVDRRASSLTFLNFQYGGLIRYISSFSNLEKRRIVCSLDWPDFYLDVDKIQTTWRP